MLVLLELETEELAADELTLLAGTEEAEEETDDLAELTTLDELTATEATLDATELVAFDEELTATAEEVDEIDEEVDWTGAGACELLDELLGAEDEAIDDELLTSTPLGAALV